MGHYGLAARVREESGAWIGMHEQEAAHLPRRRGDADSIVDSIRRWLVACGVPWRRRQRRDAPRGAGGCRCRDCDGTGRLRTLTRRNATEPPSLDRRVRAEPG